MIYFIFSRGGDAKLPKWTAWCQVLKRISFGSIAWVKHALSARPRVTWIDSSGSQQIEEVRARRAHLTVQDDGI